MTVTDSGLHVAITVGGTFTLVILFIDAAQHATLVASRLCNATKNLYDELRIWFKPWTIFTVSKCNLPTYTSSWKKETRESILRFSDLASLFSAFRFWRQENNTRTTKEMLEEGYIQLLTGVHGDPLNI